MYDDFDWDASMNRNFQNHESEKNLDFNKLNNDPFGNADAETAPLTDFSGEDDKIDFAPGEEMFAHEEVSIFDEPVWKETGSSEPAEDRIDEEVESTEAAQPAPSGGNIDKRFDELAYQIDSLHERIEVFQEFDRLKDVIVKQARIIEKYNDDLVLKSQIPIFKMIIDYIDQITDILRTQDEMEDHADSVIERHRRLKEDLEGLQRYMVGELSNYSISAFSDSAEDPLTRSRRMTVDESVESTNENEFLALGENVKTFYRQRQPGYVLEQLNLTDSSTGQPVQHVLRNEIVEKVNFRREDIF